MKFKLRADEKDVKIFVIFSIILLYFVSVIIGNAVNFINGEPLVGLNPLVAFTDYLAFTMIVYIIFLIVILTSVSSKIFEKEKGFGFAIAPKKDKGYSRWLEPKELKKDKDIVKINSKDKNTKAAGIPLINNGKEIWVDNSGFHSIILGSTGSGKTQMLVQPMVKLLAKNDESMIITDPKGEIYEQNAAELKDRGYNIILLNFREPQKGNCWNPLNSPYKLYKQGDIDKSTELLEDLAKNILYDESTKGQDPFWEKTGADYFTGLALSLFDDAKEEEINLNSINLMSTIGEEKIRGSHYINEYFKDKDKTSSAYIDVVGTLSAPNETRASIISVFKQKIKIFSSRKNLSEMLSYSDFDMEDIGKKKTAVFIIIQDEKKTYHPLVTIFLKQCYETLIRVAQENREKKDNKGELEFRTNFILDEFANMPPITDMTSIISAARSRNIRMNLIIQNFSQLNDVYGKDAATTIKGNCSNIIYLISSELTALEEISKMCGEVKSKKDDKTSSTPLVTVSDLQRLSEESMILLRLRSMPFKTKLMFNWKMDKMNLWGTSYELSTYPLREQVDVKTFDIKAVVDAQREDRVNEMFRGSDMMAPRNNSNSVPFGVKQAEAIVGKKQAESLFNGKENLSAEEVIKRIDLKIAQLEAEEKLNQEKARNSIKATVSAKGKGSSSIVEVENKEENIKPIDNKVVKPIEVKIKPEVVEVNKDIIKVETKEVKPTEEKVVETKKVEPIIVKENKSVETEKVDELSEITDDQFFDDFFYDEDE